MRIGGRFLRDVLTLQASSAVGLACQIATAWAVAEVLGAGGQGLFVSAVALQTLFYALLQVGATLGTASQIAAAAARGDTEAVAGWVAFLVKLTLVFALALLVAGNAALPSVARALYDEPEIGRQAGWLCALPLVELPRVVAGVVFQGTRRMRALALLESGHELARLALVVGGALLVGSPAGAVLGALAAGGVASLLALALYARARRDGGVGLPAPRELPRRLRQVDLRRGARLGWRIVALKNAQVLACHVAPRLILGATTGQEWVAYFHVAERILGVPLLLTRAVGRTLLAAAGELAALRSQRRFARLLRRATWTTGGLVTAAIAVTVAATPWLVALVFPEDYAGPVLLLAAILALGNAAQAFGVGIDAYFIVTGRMRAWYALAGLGVAVVLPLDVWLVRSLPRTGAAWGATAFMSWNAVVVAWILVQLRRRERAQRRDSAARYAQLAAEADADSLPFMNYGYAPLDGEPEPPDEPHRAHAALYDQLLREVIPRGRDVLEVGCGRGGGCDHLARHHAPRTLVGIDRSAENVALGRARFPGLDLREGDAEALSFAAHSFDLVLSVESLHDCARPWRVLAEARRVLRPGGRLLLADYLPAVEVAALRADLEESGLVVEDERDLRAHVLAAMERDEATRAARLRRMAPDEARFRELAEVAALAGTRRRAEFADGRLTYVGYRCRRPGGAT